MPVDEIDGDRNVGGFFFSPTLHGTVYRPDDAVRREVLDRFRVNLTEIINTARDEGIKVVLCTAPSNIAHWPPDPGDRVHPDPEEAGQWERLTQKALAFERKGQAEAALETYRTAAGIWDEDALFCFRFGRSLLHAGQGQEALYYLKRARDLDPTPVRATSRINQVIRDLCLELDASLADLDGAFASHSPSGSRTAMRSLILNSTC